VPPTVRRRRRPRLSRAGALLVAGALVGALVLAALVGGLLRAHSQSSGYERAIDRSYAAQARLVVEESDRLDVKLRALLRRMPRQSRTTLELGLDTLVRASASLAQEAATAASPPPSSGAGADVAAAMDDRADAVRLLRSAVDGLLGMAPLPVVGAPVSTEPMTPAQRLSAPEAAAELAKAGLLLAEGDRSYAEGRRALRLAPGHALLPPSAWFGHVEALSRGGALALADALAGSPSLAAVHRVELVTHAVALTPAPVPSSGGATPGGPVAVLPPTGRIGLSVVIANDGNVTERGIVVRATVQRASRSAAASSSGGAASGAERAETSRRIALSPGSSISVTLPPIPVVPGHRYTIAVVVDPPVPDTQGAITSDALSVRVAPPASPTVGQLLPAKGPAGTGVTILGSAFTWVRTVTFGHTAARFRVVSSAQITVVAPPGRGTVAVHVTNPGGSSASTPADVFRYRRS
jgi:hypothetical protein